MGQEYSFETVDRAEELYCVDGLTFDAVAGITEVAVSTLKRWSEKYGWQEKKEEIRQAMSSIRANTIRLRARLIENCLNSLAAKDAYAVASIENMALKAVELAQKTSVSGTESSVVRMREIKTDTDAVAALEEAVQMKLNLMLTKPGQMKLAAVKEVKETLALLNEMRAKVGKDRPEAHAAADKRLDPDTLKKVREQIYGVS